MQTTLETKGWARASRFCGAMRYYCDQLGKTVLCVGVVLVVAELLSYVMGAATSAYSSTGVTANFGMSSLVAFVLACWVTGKGTTFLTRFGTPRTSAWLGGLVSLVLWSLAMLAVTFSLSAMMSAVTLALHTAMPDRFALVSYYDPSLSSGAVFETSLVYAVRDLPKQALWLAEWCCMFYFVGACLRRNRWLTIGILVGVPLAAALALLVPAVRETIAAVENATESQLAVLGMKWMAWLSRLTQWVERNWQWVQAGAALGCLPLSWLVMRSTPQP